MASSLALRKLIAPNVLTRSIIQFRPPRALSSRFLNSESSPYSHSKHVVEFQSHRTFVDELANVFRKAFYSLLDSRPSAPVSILASRLNTPARRWKVSQTADALLLCADTSGVDLKVSVERKGPRNSHPFDDTRYFGYGCEQKHWAWFRVYVYECIVNPPAVLIIETTGSEDEKDCTFLIDLPFNFYDNSAIKIEEVEEDKVLKVTVPKLKPRWIHQVCFGWRKPNAPATWSFSWGFPPSD